MSHRDAYICGECKHQLNQIRRLQEQLGEVKNDICEKLEGLHVLGHGLSTGSKQPIDLTSATGNISKSARIQITTLSNRAAECLIEEHSTPNECHLHHLVNQILTVTVRSHKVLQSTLLT